MDTQAIIAALDQEIVRLQQARTILASAINVNGIVLIKRGPGRPKSGASVVAPKKRTGMSPEARERIAAAQKTRWAKVRRAAKKAANGLPDVLYQ